MAFLLHFKEFGNDGLCLLSGSCMKGDGRSLPEVVNECTFMFVAKIKILGISHLLCFDSLVPGLITEKKGFCCDSG